MPAASTKTLNAQSVVLDAMVVRLSRMQHEAMFAKALTLSYPLRFRPTLCSRCQRQVTTIATSTRVPSPPYDVLFLTSSNFSQPALTALHHAHQAYTQSGQPQTAAPTPSTQLPPVRKLAVLTPADQRRGRGMRVQPLAIKQYASDTLRLPTYSLPANTVWSMQNVDFDSEEWQSVLQQYNLLIVVSFGYRIPPSLLSRCLILNIHPSLLPLYRGASPIQSALLNDEQVTGCSIMQLSEQIDSGNVLWQRQYNVQPTDTYQHLEQELGQLGASGIVDVLNDLPHHLQNGVTQGEMLQRQPVERHRLAAPKLKKHQAQVQWHQQTAKQVYNLFRALDGWLPVYTYFSDWRSGELKRVQIVSCCLGTEVHDEFATLEPGTVCMNNRSKQITVACKPDLDDPHTRLCISILQIQQKPRPTPSSDFWSAYCDKADKPVKFVTVDDNR